MSTEFGEFDLSHEILNILRYRSKKIGSYSLYFLQYKDITN